LRRKNFQRQKNTGGALSHEAATEAESLAMAVVHGLVSLGHINAHAEAPRSDRITNKLRTSFLPALARGAPEASPKACAAAARKANARLSFLSRGQTRESSGRTDANATLEYYAWLALNRLAYTWRPHTSDDETNCARQISTTGVFLWCAAHTFAFNFFPPFNARSASPSMVAMPNSQAPCGAWIAIILSRRATM